jgi:hypothetical protein
LRLHEDDEDDDDSNDYEDATDGRAQPMDATDGSNRRRKQPMEEALLDGTTLMDDRTANDTGKWNGGQMPIGSWINDIYEALLYCKALKAVTTAQWEGSQRCEQAFLEARTLLQQLGVRRHAISPLSADR